jgi:predicted Rossmann fold nucleotide-binding protein DprA/Smf involved in DNA uptake
LRAYLGACAPEAIFSLGNLDILERKPLALFCSVKCPGNLILKTYDLARELRDKGVTVISGFHSPMEKECLSLLLRGKQPVIWCPAKRLPAPRLRQAGLTGKGIPKDCNSALSEGRLLVLSPFDERVARATEETALFRNEFVAALAERVFVAHAVHESKTEALCRNVLKWRKPLLTFDDPENAALVALGASAFDARQVSGAFAAGLNKGKEEACST